jgi:hypothetical protein
MAKRGRSSDYKSEHSNLAHKFCMLGTTDDELARLFDAGRGAIDDWIGEIPDFAAAITAGRDLADATFAERLYAGAIGYSQPAVKIFQSNGRPLEVSHTEHCPPDDADALALTFAHPMLLPDPEEERRCEKRRQLKRRIV